MTIRIEIFGESARDALDELKIIATALTGTASTMALTTGNVGTVNAKQDTAAASVGPATFAPENQVSDGDGSTAPTNVSPSDETADDEIDAHGHPWSANLHASTKGTTKDGLWRMKVGVTRPDPMPGFPQETASTPSETSTASPVTPVADTVTEPAGSTPTEAPASVAASPDEDDEFAAFQKAAAKADSEEASAKANVPTRKYTDADLGALCNQAAMKLGDPAPVRDLIAAHVPEGEVQHSRNVPEDRRAAFVTAVEAKAGIEFAG